MPPPNIFSVTASNTTGTPVTITGESFGHDLKCLDWVVIGNDNSTFGNFSRLTTVSSLNNTHIVVTPLAGNGNVR